MIDKYIMSDKPVGESKDSPKEFGITLNLRWRDKS